MPEVIGLDVHAKSCVYKVNDENGSLVDSGSFPSTPRDVTELAKKYPEATVVIEASGLSEWVYDLFAELGLKPVLCHPLNIRRLLGKKSDEIDAGFLADSYQLGCLPRSWVPPKSIRVLRDLTRRCAFLTESKARIKNRIHAKLKRKGVQILDGKTGLPVPDIFAKKHRKKLLAVKDPEIDTMLTLLDIYQDLRNKADNELIMICAGNEDIRYLRTIPGFGPLVSVGIYAEIGDVSRFTHADALGSYFGLVPMESQSGDTHYRGHITQRGSPIARWLLTQAAWSHVKICPQSSISKKYRRLYKRIGKKKAIVAVSRMLLKVTYHLLMEKRAFRPDGEPRPTLVR
jgi:transposase